MTHEQYQVKDCMQRFGQETPDKPAIPSLEVRKLRAKLILEEALETIHALGLAPFNSWLKHLECAKNVKYFDFKEIHLANLTEIADGCEDLKVVTEGTLIACGLVSKSTINNDSLVEIDPLFNEVMRSNNSKMWRNGDVSHTQKDWTIKSTDGKISVVKDSSGKVIKSPSYSPPNLEPIINKL